MTTWLNTSIEMQFRVIDGLTVRFAQSENRDDHALLLSPWPESLLAFEPVWSRLAEHTHLVAIDLPGFGHSQRRDALLSPRAMGEFIVRAADAFGLDHPHVVGPGTGTAAALFAAAAHPGRLRSLVVGSGAAAVPLELGGLLKDWVEAPDLEEFRRADPRQIVATAAGRHRAVRAARRRPRGLPGRPTRATGSPSRCATCAPTRPSFPCWATCCRRYRRRCRSSPARHDTAVPPVNAEFLLRPAAAQQARHPRRGPLHLGRRPGEYAALVTSWWSEGHAAVTGPRGTN